MNASCLAVFLLTVGTPVWSSAIGAAPAADMALRDFSGAVAVPAQSTATSSTATPDKVTPDEAAPERAASGTADQDGKTSSGAAAQGKTPAGKGAGRAPAKGKVLFERHATDAATDEGAAADSSTDSEGKASPEAGAATDAGAGTPTGLSSSRSRRRRSSGLQRRTPAEKTEASGANAEGANSEATAAGDTEGSSTSGEAGDVRPSSTASSSASSSPETSGGKAGADETRGISSSARDSISVSSGADGSGTDAEEAAAMSATFARSETEADRKAVAAIPDEERRAVRIVSTDLDLHLNRHTGAMTARARVMVKNGGAEPLRCIPLQISSSLKWESARRMDASVRLPLEQHRIVTDADHTGAATELGLVLPKPLAPGATVSLDLFYGGVLRQSAERLVRIGAPVDRAAQSDWDTVSDSFTGLRGFGNVLWMPSASEPLVLAQSDRFVTAVDAMRARSAESRVSLRLTLESSGPLPDAAFFNGERQVLAETGREVASDAEDGTMTLLTANWPSMPAGYHLPSLFVTASAPQESSDGLLRVVTEHADTVAAYAAAAQRVKPLLNEWMGGRPLHALDVIDLPVEGGLPFLDRSLLVLPLHAAEAGSLAPSLVYPLTSAWLPPDPEIAPWLSEGLPEFLRLMYLEGTEGREKAMSGLSAGMGALARVEGSPEPLLPPLSECTESVCARVKSAYVFSMLRQMAGDTAMQQALGAWVTRRNASQAPGADRKARAESDAALLRQLMEQTTGKSFDWFFADWVNRDSGLPDLNIVLVAPRRVERATVNNNVRVAPRPVAGPIGAEPVAKPGDPAQPETASEASRNKIGPAEGSWLVAVEVQNNGEAAAEVPVRVLSGALQNVLPLRIAAHSRATVRVPFEMPPEQVLVNDGTTPEMRGATHKRSIHIPGQ